jgi:hypothetical protein
MKGKIHPTGVTSQHTGPTFTENDPAKFHGPGKSSGKIGVNGVEVGPTGGDTFTVNKPAIGAFPSKPGKERTTKVESEKCAPTFDIPDTTKELTASQEGPGGPKDRAYPLKDRYQKGNRK